MALDPALYSFGPHPDLPGWSLWRVNDAARFNTLLGDLAIHCAEDGRILMRMQPGQHLSNLVDGLHGGALMSFIDVALFIGPMARGDAGALGGATIDLRHPVRSAGRSRPAARPDPWRSSARRAGCASCAASSNRVGT